MTRLPTVSGDANSWGAILNAFLAVGHNPDGTLLIAQGQVITSIDNNGVSSSVFLVNGNNYPDFVCNASDVFQFSGANGAALFYLNGSTQGNSMQLGPNIVIQGSTGPGPTVSANILGVSNPGGITQLQAHSGGNQVQIIDSSGNVIASFAGTNKITTLKGGQIEGRTAVSGNYTILASDYIIAYTSTSSAFVATLPAAAAGNAGQTWIVKDESGAANTNNITVKTAGGTIDGVAGGTGKVINTAYGVLRVYSNGTNYFTF